MLEATDETVKQMVLYLNEGRHSYVKDGGDLDAKTLFVTDECARVIQDEVGKVVEECMRTGKSASSGAGAGSSSR